MKLLETRGPHVFGPWRVTQIVEWDGEAFPHSFLFPGIPIDELRACIPAGKDGRLTDEGVIITSTQLFVLQTEDHVVLIEQGTGNGKSRPEAPYWDHQNLPYNETLASLGVRPEDVDFVFFSHLHKDHVGLATAPLNNHWTPTFPRATYVLSRREWDYWNGLDRQDPLWHPCIDDSVLPLVNEGRVRFVRHGELVAGIRIHEAPGHTPGFLLFEVEGCGLWFIGDMLHHPAQGAHPEWPSADFDTDPLENQAQRYHYFKLFAESGAWVLGVHTGDLFQIMKKQAGRFVVQYQNQAGIS
jgi:glyoxylase-like metal-dependent hydrolase (beta-lactamase superfamily II)